MPRYTTDYNLDWSNEDLAIQFQHLISEMADRGRGSWEAAFERLKTTNHLALEEMVGFVSVIDLDDDDEDDSDEDDDEEADDDEDDDDLADSEHRKEKEK